jgi:hypothetical protein
MRGMRMQMGRRRRRRHLIHESISFYLFLIMEEVLTNDHHSDECGYHLTLLSVLSSNFNVYLESFCGY